jgi:hypothetical protein
MDELQASKGVASGHWPQVTTVPPVMDDFRVACRMRGDGVVNETTCELVTMVGSLRRLRMVTTAKE